MENMNLSQANVKLDELEMLPRLLRDEAPDRTDAVACAEPIVELGAIETHPRLLHGDEEPDRTDPMACAEAMVELDETDVLHEVSEAHEGMQQHQVGDQTASLTVQPNQNDRTVPRHAAHDTSVRQEQARTDDTIHEDGTVSVSHPMIFRGLSKVHILNRKPSTAEPEKHNGKTVSFAVSSKPMGPSVFAHLPDDIIRTISGFDPRSNLNAVSSSTWDALGPHGIRGAYVVTPGNVSAIESAVSEQAISDPISYRIPVFDTTLQARLSSLCLATSLKALKIVFRPTDDALWHKIHEGGIHWRRHSTRYSTVPQEDVRNCISWMGDPESSMIEATIEVLAATSQLQILDLDFSLLSTSFQADSANIVARLKTSRALRMLRLTLIGSCLGVTGNTCDIGARCLGTLKESQTLHTIHLNIKEGGSMGPAGALAINELKNMPTLHTFSLILGGIPYRCGAFGPIGIRALVDLSLNASLDTLELNFDYSGIRNADPFRGLQNVPHLCTLYLSVDANQLGDDGAAIIANALRRAPVLRTLHLSLAGNQIGDQGATELALLAENEALRILNLNLQSNKIGEIGAVALSKMQLADLSIDLRLNNIHNPVAFAKPKGFLGFYRDW
jgi:hypothetical protein